MNDESMSGRRLSQEPGYPFPDVAASTSSASRKSSLSSHWSNDSSPATSGASTPALEPHARASASSSRRCSTNSPRSRRGSSNNVESHPLTPTEGQDGDEHFDEEPGEDTQYDEDTIKHEEGRVRHAGSTPGLAPPLAFVPFSSHTKNKAKSQTSIRRESVEKGATTPVDVQEARLRHAGSTPGLAHPEMVSIDETTDEGVSAAPTNGQVEHQTSFPPAKDFKMKDPPLRKKVLTTMTTSDE